MSSFSSLQCVECVDYERVFGRPLQRPCIRRTRPSSIHLVVCAGSTNSWLMRGSFGYRGQAVYTGKEASCGQSSCECIPLGISLKIVVIAHTVAIEDTCDGMTHDELVQHFGVHVGGGIAEVLVLHRFHFGVRERRAPVYRQSGGALDEVVGVDGGAHGSSLVRVRIIMALTARFVSVL